MWEKNYQLAATEAEEIFARPEYGLMDEPKDVFNAANLNHKEALLVNQFLDGKGGGGTLSGGKYTGHRLSAFTVAAYGSSSGTGSWAFENGGFGWGRIFPNHYCCLCMIRRKISALNSFSNFIILMQKELNCLQTNCQVIPVLPIRRLNIMMFCILNVRNSWIDTP